MSTVEEIKAAIATLSLEQRAEVAKFIHGWDDDEWDREIIDDLERGKLDKLLTQVKQDIKSDRLEDGP